MILPNKTVKPVDSLFCIASSILEECMAEDLSFDQIYEKIQGKYPKPVSLENTLLCLDYLYIVGKLDIENEIIKIKF